MCEINPGTTTRWTNPSQVLQIPLRLILLSPGSNLIYVQFLSLAKVYFLFFFNESLFPIDIGGGSGAFKTFSEKKFGGNIFISNFFSKQQYFFKWPIGQHFFVKWTHLPEIIILMSLRSSIKCSAFLRNKVLSKRTTFLEVLNN